jgi:serine/threonine protein kinase
MGVVFEARHVRLGQKAALKVLYPRFAANSSFRELLFREARLLARLHHPNLVHPIDVGSDGDYHYLALELVEGEDLLQRVTSLVRLSPEEEN